MSNTEFSSAKNRLFIEERNPNRGAWISNPANKFFLYSEGYRAAGQILYDYCIENSCCFNTLVYPLIFNYRQFLELRLKELIIMGNRYTDINKDFPKIHCLSKLWKIYRNDLLPNIDNTIDFCLLNNVENLITQFTDIDPESTSFRYPVKRTPNREESISMKTIDIENFKIHMDELIIFFDCQWEMIHHYEDFKQEMLSEFYRGY